MGLAKSLVVEKVKKSKGWNFLISVEFSDRIESLIIRKNTGEMNLA